MNKKEIRKHVRARPNEEEVKATTLAIADAEAPDYLELLAKVNPKVARAVQLYLAGGYKRVEIAGVLGVKPATISKWLNLPEIKHYMAEFRKDEAELVRARMHAASAAALDKMVGLLDSPIDGVALQAARDLLDRTGHKPKQEVKKEVVVKTFEQQLSELVLCDPIDVDYEEYYEEDEEGVETPEEL